MGLEGVVCFFLGGGSSPFSSVFVFIFDLIHFFLCFWYMMKVKKLLLSEKYGMLL